MLSLYIILALAEFTVSGATRLHVRDVHEAVAAMAEQPQAEGARQMRVTLTRANGKAAASMAVRSHRFTNHELVVRRGRNLAEELDGSRVLILGVDGAGHIRFWETQHDPRIIRGEFPGPGGPIEGRTVENPNPEMLLDLPADPRITAVRIYEQKGEVLSLLGRFTLPAIRK